MNNFDNRRWLVIPINIINNIDFNEILETSIDNLRYNLDNTKTFIKYDVNVVDEDYDTIIFDMEKMIDITQTIKKGIYGRPSIYSNEYTEYNHDEIINLLLTDEWNDRKIK